MSQCDRLLDHLKKAPINPMQAWQKLGIYRLASRIKDRKEQGHKISRELVTVRNRFGEESMVAQYRMEQR